MNDDPFPVESGTFGKVDHVDDIGTVHCIFDNGRTLGVIPSVDDFHIVSEDSEQTEDEEMNISMLRSSFEKSLTVFLFEKSEEMIRTDKIFRYLCRNSRIPIGT